MNDWQSWVVALLVIFCVLRIGIGVLSFFRRSKQNNNPCSNCVTGCKLKRLYDEKQAECNASRKKMKKSCCE